MKRHCRIALNDCPGVDYPVSNFTSEAPDPVTFYSIAFPPPQPWEILPPPVPPPDGGEPVPDPDRPPPEPESDPIGNEDSPIDCSNINVVQSYTSQAEADLFAQMLQQYCSNPDDPPWPVDVPPDWPPDQPWPPTLDQFIELVTPPPPVDPSISQEEGEIYFPEFTPVVTCLDVALETSSEFFYGAVGGAADYEIEYSVVNGAIPPGTTLSFAQATVLGLSGTRNVAYLSGTPNVAGSYTFTLRADVTNRTNKFAETTITVWVLGLYDDVYGPGRVCYDYSSPIVAVGGPPPIIYGVVSGTLPPGLELDSDGLLHGTPTAAGSYSFTVSMTAGGLTCYDVVYIQILPGITITPSLPAGAKGNPYSGSISGSGGTAPYTYEIIGGSMPDGLSFDSNTGAITGTPSTCGGGSFTVRVTDSLGIFCTAGFSISITGVCTCPPWGSVEIASASYPTAGIGTASGTALTAAVSGGPRPGYGDPQSYGYATIDGKIYGTWTSCTCHIKVTVTGTNMGVPNACVGQLFNMTGSVPAITWEAPGVYEQDFVIVSRTNGYFYYTLYASAGDNTPPITACSQNVTVEFTNVSAP